MRRRGLAALLICAAAVSGCRDGVQPFANADEPEPGDTYQLTYNPSRDFAPAWSRGSDTVFYTTAHFPDAPRLATTLIRVGLSGRGGSLHATNAQPDSLMHIAAGVASPDGSRLAYLHIPFINSPASCGVGSPPASLPPLICRTSEPLLGQGFIRVRSRDATTRATSDVGTPIPFLGVDPARAAGGADSYDQQSFPYQQAWRDRGEFLSRPSWSPDGQTIAFSDGLNLRIWRPSQGDAAVIPNTADGVSAAWSPAGSEIAFSRLLRIDSTLISCGCNEPGTIQLPPPVHNRWIYTVGRRVITVIQADGSGLREIADGEDPAWSPDGSTIYFAAPDGIYRVPRDGGAAVLVPSTAGGRSPAVSPDGRWLAFTRADQEYEDVNIWITRIGAP